MHSALVLALLVSAAPSSAEDQATTRKARELFQSGMTSFKKARYAEALATFEQVWALRPHPSVQFNLGRCHEQLGDVPRALRAYREYLRLSPKAQDREQVFDSIAQLERKLRDQGLQQLSVSADQPEARVFVDKVDLGLVPATVVLPTGLHQLQVTAAGFETYASSVELMPSQPADITVVLRREREPEVRSPLADAPKVEPAPRVLTPALVPPPPPPLVATVSVEKQRGRVWTWVAGGVAVAGAGAGAGLLAAANSNADTLRMVDPQRTGRQAEDLSSSANTMAVGSTVAFAVAGTAAVTAVILFILEK